MKDGRCDGEIRDMMFVKQLESIGNTIVPAVDYSLLGDLDFVR